MHRIVPQRLCVVYALLRGMAIAATLLPGAAASAAPIFTVSGGSPATESGNDFLWITGPVTEGGTLGLSEPGILTLEYIGKEAGFVATELWFGAFAYPGGTLVATTNSGLPITEGQTAALPFPPPGIVRGLAPYTTEAIGAGALPFYFRVPGNSGAVVANGDPPGADGSPGIALWWPGGSSLGDTVYVLLDDGGGFNPGEPSDNDHDDMIVRLTVTPIPEPASGALVLAGLGLLARRARRAGARETDG